MSTGALNPCPYRCGGPPSPSEKAYAAMRRAVGTGGSAADDSGLDGLWRRSRAKGLAAGGSSGVRAALQSWPHLATDALPYYARVLGPGCTQGPHETEADWRDRIVAAWVSRMQADCPHLLDQLQAIDPRCSILEPDYTTTTQHGRAFAPLDPALESPAWGLASASIAPNYSTDFIVFVLFDAGYAGALVPADQRILEAIKSMLRDVLPSWVSFVVVTDTGFLLDLSPLDITGFGT